MRKYLIGFALVLITMGSLYAGENIGITVKNGIVSMPLHTFRELVTYIKRQNEAIKSLQDELDTANNNLDNVEDCVRNNVENHELVLKCFGDVEG